MNISLSFARRLLFAWPLVVLGRSSSTDALVGAGADASVDVKGGRGEGSTPRPDARADARSDAADAKAPPPDGGRTVDASRSDAARDAPAVPPPADAASEANALDGTADGGPGEAGNDAPDAACAAPRQICGGACTDPSNDPTSCGACGNACEPGGACTSGACSCPAGKSDCGPVIGCIDATSDPRNCGACGNACEPGALCTNGVCGCPVGDLECGAVVGCVDPTTDPDHCGSCTGACPAGDDCAASSCSCAAGNVECTGACTSLETDPGHCGACATACAPGDVCTGGACACPTGSTDCGSPKAACTDTARDPEHCGACDRDRRTVHRPSPRRRELRRVRDRVRRNGTLPGRGLYRDRALPGRLDPLRRGDGGACYTAAELGASPLHCSNLVGSCGLACATDQVCTRGVCTGFFTSTACTTCPCVACGAGTTCCAYPGRSEPICVTGNACPL